MLKNTTQKSQACRSLNKKKSFPSIKKWYKITFMNMSKLFLKRNKKRNDQWVFQSNQNSYTLAIQK